MCALPTRPDQTVRHQTRPDKTRQDKTARQDQTRQDKTRQTGRQAGKQTDRQTDGQTDRQTDSQTGQVGIYIYIYISLSLCGTVFGTKEPVTIAQPQPLSFRSGSSNAVPNSTQHSCGNGGGSSAEVVWRAGLYALVPVVQPCRP